MRKTCWRRCFWWVKRWWKGGRQVKWRGRHSRQRGQPKQRKWEQHSRCGVWKASPCCWSVKFMAWRGDHIFQTKLRIYSPSEVECSKSGVSQKIPGMMSPIRQVVRARSTASSTYSCPYTPFDFLLETMRKQNSPYKILRDPLTFTL